MREELSALYGRAPIWAQHVMCSAEGLRLRRLRFPARFDARLRLVRARSRWTAAQVAADRLARLRALLVHARAHVPYWRDAMAAAGLVPERIAHVDELEALPPCSKDTVVREGDRMRATAIPHGRDLHAIELQTSGTTGAGMHLRASIDAVHEQWAMCWRYRMWHGLAPGTWCGQLGGRVIVPPTQHTPPFHRINWPGRQVLLSSYHLGPATAGAYLDVLRERAVPWIHGYPSMVATLAECMLERHERLPAVMWVTLASESVSASTRRRIREAFGVEPREHYAQTEAVANISECTAGRLHVDEDFSVVELVPHARDHDDALLYRVLGTSLDNYHQPFIRYDTGDLVRLADGCDCGLGGRVIAAIDGRREDVLVLPSGALVGRVDHIFKSLESTREAQIRQAADGSVTILVVPRREWTEADERALRLAWTTRLGHELALRIVVVAEIPRESSGKLRMVVREGSR